MSTVNYTAQCYPERNAMRLFLGGFVAEPDHDRCPGGFHLSGVIGGWHCPCPCHQSTPSPIDVDCPTCGSPAGAPCRTLPRPGVPSVPTTLHRARTAT